MRLPDAPSLPIAPVTERKDIAPLSRVDGARPVNPSPPPPTVPMPAGELPVPEQEDGRDAGPEGTAEERVEEDRRKMCRRIYHLPVILDTRSGLDRRQDHRREDDPLTGISTAA